MMLIVFFTVVAGTTLVLLRVALTEWMLIINLFIIFFKKNILKIGVGAIQPYLPPFVCLSRELTWGGWRMTESLHSQSPGIIQKILNSVLYLYEYRGYLSRLKAFLRHVWARLLFGFVRKPKRILSIFNCRIWIRFPSRSGNGPASFPKQDPGPVQNFRIWLWTGSLVRIPMLGQVDELIEDCDWFFFRRSWLTVWWLRLNFSQEESINWLNIAIEF